MKPSPSDYLPFLEAARGHEANARASGSLVDAELARLMHAEATRLRLEALYPPEPCVECRAVIHSHEMKCAACGRARQGVEIGTRHVINLVRFLEGYDFDSVAAQRANQLARQKKKRALMREEREAAGLGGRSKPNSIRSWAVRLGMANSSLLTWVRRKGSLQAAVEHFAPGAWPGDEKGLQSVATSLSSRCLGPRR